MRYNFYVPMKKMLNCYIRRKLCATAHAISFSMSESEKSLDSLN